MLHEQFDCDQVADRQGQRADVERPKPSNDSFERVPSADSDYLERSWEEVASGGSEGGRGRSGTARGGDGAGRNAPQPA